MLSSQIFAVADSAGGAAGIALEQTQISQISGAGSASAKGGAGLLIENGYSFANTIAAMDLEVAPTCLVIASRNAAHNTFISPYMACPTAVDASSPAIPPSWSTRCSAAMSKRIRRRGRRDDDPVSAGRSRQAPDAPSGHGL